MKNRWERDYLILSSSCDAQGLLGIKNIFDIFMDMAAVHADHLGVSYYAMLERRCYWVAVRTRVRLYERPLLGAQIMAETWPSKPGLAKSDRFYRLTENGKLLAEGRTEWAAQDIDTGAIRRTESYGYPTELEHYAERLCVEPFTRFRPMERASENLVRTYTVGSQDIDVGQHMNNVAYIRMLLGTFTTAELAAMDISEVEISYRLGCYEGEALEIYRTQVDGGLRFDVIRPDGETAVQAIIKIR